MFTFTDVPSIECEIKAGKIVNPEFLAKCPPGCQDGKYRTYGTDIYSSISSICSAAIHRFEVKYPVLSVMFFYLVTYFKKSLLFYCTLKFIEK